jgi:hypothetical protein
MIRFVFLKHPTSNAIKYTKGMRASKGGIDKLLAAVDVADTNAVVGNIKAVERDLSCAGLVDDDL